MPPDCCIAVYDAAGAVCSLGPVLLPAAQRLGPVVEICAVCSPGGGLCADHTALRTAAYEQPEKYQRFACTAVLLLGCGSSLPAGRGRYGAGGKTISICLPYFTKIDDQYFIVDAGHYRFCTAMM